MFSQPCKREAYRLQFQFNLLLFDTCSHMQDVSWRILMSVLRKNPNISFYLISVMIILQSVSAKNSVRSDLANDF